jgi:polyisoprenoid-binding protein YceI
MKRRTPKAMTLSLALAALGLLALASSAHASSLNLKCSGKGVQNKAQEYETASCAVEAGKKRNLEGVLRNDKNKPVAGKLNVTISDWNLAPGGGAFDIEPTKTFEIKAAANGKFKVPVTTTTEETVYIEAVGDPELEVSALTQEVNIQRYVSATAKVLGGGKVKVTVKGIEGPFKVAITEEYGYPAPGGASRKAKNGTATFDLHGARGTFGISVDAGELTDLYYIDSHPFKL